MHATVWMVAVSGFELQRLLETQLGTDTVTSIVVKCDNLSAPVDELLDKL